MAALTIVHRAFMVTVFATNNADLKSRTAEDYVAAD